jgi:hypothetical protein
MPFSVKQWLNKVGSGTVLDAPTVDAETHLDAAAMRDLETRLSGYTDAQVDTAGNGRVLLWDTVTAAYKPTAWLADTSRPREFVGPTDPETILAVSGPVFGDRWTPTAS